jgi:hypothetical protein
MRVARGQHADVLGLEMRCPRQRIETSDGLTYGAAAG